MTEGDVHAWLEPLSELTNRIRRTARALMEQAVREGHLARVDRPVGQGAGDVTYGIDVATEEVARTWFAEVGRESPLSLLTEDAGWRHLGPDGPLPGFDHGGPRIALDPIDGTRNLMADLRAAWTVMSFAGPGPREPRFADIELGIVSEIPDSRAARFRALEARRGAGCRYALASLEDAGIPGRQGEAHPLVADDDDRPDHGYFPFFAYSADLRPEVSDLQRRFLERLERFEGAEVESCYDDQYISSGGQLVLTALGTYRLVVEARGLLADRRGRPTTTAKPYDMAGAALCATEAGCVVTAPNGEELDFPIDAHTPVSFVAYANAATAARLQPHLSQVLGP